MRALGILVAVVLVSRGTAWAEPADDAKRCYAESNADLALEACSRAIQSGQLSDTNLAITYNNRGNIYTRKHEYDRAIQDYDQAIRLTPNEPRAFFNRGSAYRSKGEDDRAIQDYDQAIRLNPNYADAFNNRGNAYSDQGNYDRAIQDYDQAIRLNPNDAEVFNNRGVAYRGKGEYDRAIQDYDQAIRLSPNYVRAVNNRGNAYRDKGEYDRAIQEYDWAIRLNPTDAEAFNSRGNAYRAKGEYERAIQDYDHAIGLNPNYAWAFYNRGVVRFDQGLFTAAVPDFMKAVQSAPTNHYNVIRLYLAQARAGQNGRDGLASSALRLDLKRWPGPVVAMYLGKIAPQGLIEAAADTDPKKQQEKQCQAQFYVGEYLLIQGQKNEAASKLHAVATCPQTLYEYHSAKAELHLLGR